MRGHPDGRLAGLAGEQGDVLAGVVHLDRDPAGRVHTGHREGAHGERPAPGVPDRQRQRAAGLVERLVRAEIERQVAELGINYLLTYLFLGTMTLKDAMRSLELFRTEVMPHVEKL